MLEPSKNNFKLPQSAKRLKAIVNNLLVDMPDSRMDFDYPRTLVRRAMRI